MEKHVDTPRGSWSYVQDLTTPARYQGTGLRHHNWVHGCLWDFIGDHCLDLFPTLLLGFIVVRDQRVAQGILRWRWMVMVITLLVTRWS